MKSAAFLIVLVFMTGCSVKPLQSGAPENGYDARLSKFEYPYPVKFFAFKSQDQDLQMAYMDVAPTTTEIRETLVLLHGKNFSGFYFKELIQNLRGRGYRLIVPDQIGFGKSTKPRAYQFSFHELANNTRALLQSLGISQYQVLGHSMGGMLGTRLALEFPKEVTHLILINPIGLEDYKLFAPYMPVGTQYLLELEQTPEKVRDYQKQSYYDGKWSDAYESLLQVSIGWIQGREYPLVAWNSALTADMIFTQPVWYEFKNLKVPVSLVIGLRDRTAIGRDRAREEDKKKMGQYPKLGRQTQKMIAGSKLIEIDNLGHVPFIESPEQFWKVTEALWLKP